MTDPNMQNYFNNVMSYCEELDYPSLVLMFEPEDVAKSMSRTMIICNLAGISVRMCALLIYGLTMTQQIIPYAQEQVKH